MGEVSSASTLAAALSRFLALNTRCPVTWDKTAEMMAHISTLPVDLFHMATESTRSIVSTEEEDAPAGMAGAGGPVELSEENIAALNKGAFRPPDPELKSFGNKGRILRSSSRPHTATTPPQASDLATPYSAAKRSGSATIANLDLTCISQVQPSGYTRKTVSKKTWKTAAKSKLSMDMRDTPFGSDFELDAVTSLEVASKFVGSFGAKLSDELSFACDLLNTVSVRLIEHGYHERREGFHESGFELIALALHQGLAKAMSDSKCRFRSVLLNKKNLNFAVPTLMVQFGNGILATGHGDIGTFALVGDDVDVVEFMACTSEMKSEINGTFLGQTGAEMLAFDGLQTPGQPFRVDDIADSGAHMCAPLSAMSSTRKGWPGVCKPSKASISAPVCPRKVPLISDFISLVQAMNSTTSTSSPTSAKVPMSPWPVARIPLPNWTMSVGTAKFKFFLLSKTERKRHFESLIAFASPWCRASAMSSNPLSWKPSRRSW